MQQQVSIRRLYETILCIGCSVSVRTFHLLVEHMVRGIGSTILHLTSQYYILQLLIVGNGVSFPIFRHSTQCGLIFFIIAFFLFLYHTLDWQQTLWHKLHSRHRYLVAGRTQTVLSTPGHDGMCRCYLCSNNLCWTIHLFRVLRQKSSFCKNSIAISYSLRKQNKKINK